MEYVARLVEGSSPGSAVDGAELRSDYRWCAVYHQSLPLSTIFFQLGVAVFAMLAFTSDAAVQYTATRTFHMRDTKIVQRATHPKVLEHRAQRKAQKAQKALKAQKTHNAQKAHKATSASNPHRA